MCDLTTPDHPIGKAPLPAPRGAYGQHSENDSADTIANLDAPGLAEAGGSTETIGRYTLSARIAKGGMGSVHIALMKAPAGFSRIVAIKRLHRHFADDEEFVLRFKDEVRLSAGVVHPNVVQALDVVETDGGLLLVMEYLQGETLLALQMGARKAFMRLPVEIAVAIAVASLHGLHAAHIAADEQGRPLNVVHRDVSPQNIMIGENGQIKVLDFGVARAAHQAHLTHAGDLVGKVGYLAPEQAEGCELDPRSDVFAAGIVLWEMLVGERLFPVRKRAADAEVLGVLTAPTSAPHYDQLIPPPSQLRPDVPPELDAIVLKALRRMPEDRYSTAREFAIALEAVATPPSASAIGSLVRRLCQPELEKRAAVVAALRRSIERDGNPSLDTSSGIDVSCSSDRRSDSTAAVPRCRARWTKVRVGRGTIVPLVIVFSTLLFSRRETKEAMFAGRPAPSAALLPTIPTSTTSGAALHEGAPITSAMLDEGANHGGRRAPPSRAASNASRSKQPSASTSAASLPCNPPTFLGDDGIRHFKPGCL